MCHTHEQFKLQFKSNGGKGDGLFAFLLCHLVVLYLELSLVLANGNVNALNSTFHGVELAQNPTV